MYLPRKRDLSRKNSVFIICVSVLISLIILSVCSYSVARWLRVRYSEPKYLPGHILKRRWRQWRPGNSSYGQVPTHGQANGHDTSYRGAGESGPEMTSRSSGNARNNNHNGSNNGPQRETSIRSVMTLPAYSASPKPTEQVIAREGERAGMDMVVEFPETAEEEESRREDQMEALYQLRVQRRYQLAVREARRRERREARARGESIRLDELRQDLRDRGINSSSAASTIIAGYRARERERRIASVSYADLGHVRHDGTRLRADSHNSDSDQRPLLQNAEMQESSPSLTTVPTTRSQVQSFASTVSVDADSLALRPVSTHASSVRPVSAVVEEGDLGAFELPPPGYEQLDWGEAPAYEGPIGQPARESRLPEITRLPSIHINLASPISTSPATPTPAEDVVSQQPNSASGNTAVEAEVSPETAASRDVTAESSDRPSAGPPA
ncbi:Uncharacterized protein PECH_001364 [Penicillium ucsense]|uniref:Uncharacterized protein n=1 Tax=Penicillium ucsense TaxID=2839758 RepID=A0A8J8W1F0_9EURO|nr:Uncharacterized protein PECM_008324 [Penicillium ucsense]KAF7732937.1 Uncharacterized protein PECH_001364 [Penicillium ucsense]